MVLIFREKRRKVDPKATSEIEEQDESIDIAADSHLKKVMQLHLGLIQKYLIEIISRTFLQYWKGVYVKYLS